MKKQKLWILSVLLVCLLANPLSAIAKEIKIGVKGIVCAFCAKGIEKTFKKQEVVKTVKVDLATKVVTLDLKEKQNLSDAAIKKLIEDAGYNTTYIKRD